MTLDLSQLSGWLPAQRWYAAKGQPLESVRVRADTLLGETDDWQLHDAFIEVDLGGARAPHVYQLPYVVSGRECEGFEHALISVHEGQHVYDALALPEANRMLLGLLREGAERGSLRFVSEPGAALPDLAGHPLGVEQSNSSVRYGDELLLKLFRRLAPGINPDLEITRALAEAGCAHIAPPLAWIEGELDGQAASFGIAQPYLRSATEGWRLATASVRDLFAEADLHAHEVGGDFAGESERLGAATAEVHAQLAEVLPSGVADAGECAATAAAMHRRLDEALEVVAELAEDASALRTAFDAVADYPEPVAVQRVHGDYHLGQVLRTDSGWVLLDFEGEPARPLAERLAPMSPLRDVAGMLRSFDYAAHHLLAERAATAVGDPPSMAYRASEWAERNRTAFCDGYAAAAGYDPRERSVLLRAFELDKAVYEVLYEARHRPGWLAIPLAAVRRLASEIR